MAWEATLSSTPPTGDALEVDLTTGTDIQLSMDSGETLFPPPVYEEVYASGPETEGAIRTRSRPENKVGTGRVFMKGATHAAVMANIATWEQLLEAVRRYGGELVYSPEDGPTVTYEVVSARMVTQPQRPYMSKIAESEFELTMRPFGLLAEQEGVDLRVTDSFSYESAEGSGPWRFDSGVGTLAVSDGELVPSSTATKALYRAQTAADQRQVLKFTTGTVDSGWVNLRKRGGASNLVGVELEMSANQLRVRLKDGGVDSTLGSATSYSAATSTTYWLELTFVGDTITGKIYTADPDAGATAAATVSHTLTGGNATEFGSGVYGYLAMELGPAGDTNWRYLDWYAEATSFQTTDPLLVFEVPATDGSVDALLEIGMANPNEDSRNFYHLEWGMESAYWSTAYSWPLLIDSDDMTALDAASLQTRSGGYDPDASGNNVYRQTTSTSSLGVVSVSSQHIGRFHFKARVYSSATDDPSTTFVRGAYSYRGGGTEFLPWVQLPLSAAGFAEVDLGIVNIPPPEHGVSHSVTFSLYCKEVTSAGTSLECDYFKFMPNERYGVASSTGIIVHAWIANLQIAHDGAWKESGFGTGRYDRVQGYTGSYARIPPQGGRLAIYEAANPLATSAHATGFLDDEIRVSSVNVTPRVVLLGE